MAQSSSPRLGEVLKDPSPRLSPGPSGALERRGTILPPIITDLHNEMPKQQGSSHDARHMSTIRFLKATVPEVSKWSSTSSEHSTEEGTSNGTDDKQSASSNEPGSSFDASETIEQRLSRWQKFYAEKSMESFMEKDDYEEYLDEVLFDRLYQELQYTVYETKSLQHRGQEQIRLFWDDVRRQLRDEEDMVEEWPPTEELQHCTAWIHEHNPSSEFIFKQRPISTLVAGQDDLPISTAHSKTPPSKTRSPTVESTPARINREDAELQEIREWIMNKKREREKDKEKLARLGQ